MYRRTDLAEIVSHPSPITRKYLDVWFTSEGAFGLALKKLGWPYAKNPQPLLIWDEKNGLQVDVSVEEYIFYERTIFSYKTRGTSVIATINFKKISIPRLIGTLKAVFSQSKLLVNYQKTYNLAKSYIEEIPTITTRELKSIEQTLNTVVWPNLIAVDYIGEYILSILTEKKTPEQVIEILNSIQAKAINTDWYTHAILAWDTYKQGKMSEAELLQLYGYAAGDDYELTRPRYYELLHQKKPTQAQIQINDMNIVSLEDLAVGMHYLRSEAKRKSLIWIDALRQALIAK